jgi:hypothetical protein
MANRLPDCPDTKAALLAGHLAGSCKRDGCVTSSRRCCSARS